MQRQSSISANRSAEELVSESPKRIDMIPEPMPNARSQALASQDILPIIFSYLRHSLDLGVVESEPEEANAPHWKAAFATLVLVNRAFFHAGATVLWETMSGLAPVFRLLPWFDIECKGAGATDATLPETWDRFKVYTSLINIFKFESKPDIIIPASWFIQLLTLPGRPDPFFPHLHSITFTPAAIPALHLLFLLAGPSLLNLEVATCSELLVLSDPVPDDWEYTDDPDKARGAPAHRDVLAALPRLAFAASQIQSFNYRGPVSNELICRVSCMKALTKLELVLASNQDVLSLCALRQLSLLENLKIVAPSLHTGDVDAVGIEWKETSGHFTCLRSLIVVAMEYSQWLIWKCLQPHELRCLKLYIGGKGEVLPFNMCLGSYLRTNAYIRSLLVEFMETSSSEAIPSDAILQWPSTTVAEDAANHAFASSVHLVDVTFIGIPTSLTNVTAARLQSAIRNWKQLTALQFNTSASVTGPEEGSDQHLPDLSFLHVVATKCPQLQTLEFCFNTAMLVDDGDNSAMQHLLKKVDRDFCDASQDDHPLHTLILNTRGELHLEQKGSLDLAMYLDRLFPQLRKVQGSSGLQTWENIDRLVETYQTVREHALTRIVYRTREIKA